MDITQTVALQNGFFQSQRLLLTHVYFTVLENNVTILKEQN